MRNLRPILVIALALASVPLASTAGAMITGTTGDATKIPAPPSVKLGDLTSDTKMFVFDEKTCVPLAKPVHVDITRPGRYEDLKDLTPGKIPAGTLVSSHLAHVDSVSGAKGNTIFFHGELVVDAPVLGIAILQHKLNASDVLGAVGTSYPTKLRQINLFVNDFVVLRADQRTVSVHVGNHMHMDQVRVITSCSSTATPIAPVTPARPGLTG